jgi:O-antigen ligase
MLASAFVSMLFVAGFGFLQFYEIVQEGQIMLRVISTLGNPNAVAEFLSSILIAGLIFYVVKAPSKLKLFGLVVYALAWSMFTAANSTGAWGSVVVAGFGLILLLGIFRNTLQTIRNAKVWVFSAVIVAIVSIGGFFLSERLDFASIKSVQSKTVSASLTKQMAVQFSSLTPHFVAQLNPIDYLSRLWESNAGLTRLYFWRAGLNMLYDHPITGVGLGHYEVRYGDYIGALIQTEEGQEFVRFINENFREPESVLRATKAHNDYVHAIAEMGSIGIVAVLALLLTIVIYAFIQIKRQASPSKRLILILLYCGVSAFLTDALVNFPIHLPASSLNLVLLLGLAHSRYLIGEQVRQLNLPGILLKTSGTVLVIGAVIISVFAVRDWQANVHLETGTNYLENELPQRAEAELRQSLALSFTPGAELYHLGTINFASQNEQEAIEYLENSLNLKVYEDTLWKLANLYFEQGDYDKAQQHLEHLKSIVYPGGAIYLDARYLEASIALNAGRFRRAARIAEETLTSNPEFERIILVWADAESNSQNFTRACVLYRQGLGYVETEIATMLEVLADLANNDDISNRRKESASVNIQTTMEIFEAQRQAITSILQQLQPACP